MTFGSEGSRLYPPPAAQLEATAQCRCGWEGTAYVWPLVASMGFGQRRVEAPLGHRRSNCPKCGADLDPRLRHPSAGGGASG